MRVEHPHIIPVHGAGEASGVLYIAMRYVSGGDLRTLIQQAGPLPTDRVVSLLAPVASSENAMAFNGASTELAVADQDGSTYIWKVSR